jgi:hypothetical protein
MALDLLFAGFVLFLVGLGVFAIATFFLSKSAKFEFDLTNSRVNEAGYYLNEFRKQANSLKSKAARKINAAEAEKEIAAFAKKLGVREENEKEKLKLKAIARR